ncbi:BrxA/BrxB family bacilliredoxin [Flavobacteriales bacterium]|nr:BrxA/BrxB family bacilliredoxin [Flavobacteriales bacterium]
MNYPEEMCAPMRSELVSAGFVELKTPESVSDLLNKKTGTTLVMVNSVCGCAAGNARPAVIMATNFDKQVDTFATVFAGQDIGATAKAREFMLPFPPSSPSIAVFKEGKLVHFIERHHIEGRAAEMIADNLKNCFDQIC